MTDNELAALRNARAALKASLPILEAASRVRDCRKHGLDQATPTARWVRSAIEEIDAAEQSGRTAEK